MTTKPDIDRIALDAMHEIAKVAGIRRVQAELPRRSQIQIIIEKAIRRAMERPRRSPPPARPGATTETR